MPMQVKLVNKKGETLGEATFTTTSKDWKKYAATITVTQSQDSASLVLLAKAS